MATGFGVSRLIRRCAPQLALHASTQITVHTLDGALAAKEMGFSRVVLSRECTLEEIEKITKESGVETSLFYARTLHVLFRTMLYVAVIGQRSGNRGMCAQPCRLPYTYQDGKKGNPLSLKICVRQSGFPPDSDGGSLLQNRRAYETSGI